MSLLFNIVSRFVIAFLPMSKCVLISQQQSPSAVILEPNKIKSVTVFIVSPSNRFFCFCSMSSFFFSLSLLVTF